MPPRIEFNLENLENICKLMPTYKEVATFFGCSEMTIHRRREAEPEFKDAMDRGFNSGTLSLRRWQMQAAENGSAAMLIFLGKNLLGQKDVVEQKTDMNVTQSFTLLPPKEYARPQLPTPTFISEAECSTVPYEEIRPNGSHH